MPTTIEQSGPQIVEVSGWDARREFFVESVQLESDGTSGKTLTLEHGLSRGAVVFLRLVRPLGSRWCPPVAYAAESTGVTEQGREQFLLRPVPPCRT